MNNGRTVSVDIIGNYATIYSIIPTLVFALYRMQLFVSKYRYIHKWRRRSNCVVNNVANIRNDSFTLQVTNSPRL